MKLTAALATILVLSACASASARTLSTYKEVPNTYKYNEGTAYPVCNLPAPYVVKDAETGINEYGEFKGCGYLHAAQATNQVQAFDLAALQLVVSDKCGAAVKSVTLGGKEVTPILTKYTREQNIGVKIQGGLPSYYELVDAPIEICITLKFPCANQDSLYNIITYFVAGQYDKCATTSLWNNYATTTYETPSPVYETPSPVYHAKPSPAYHAKPSPAYHAKPSPAYHAKPSPVYHAKPSPAYETPSPAYETPSPVYETPSPVYETPSPVYHAKPSPAYHAKPSPAYHAKPSPVYHAKPSPAYHAKPSPVYHAKPSPAYETPCPVYETPSPVYHAKPSPAYHAKPSPAYHAKPSPVYKAKPSPAYKAKPSPAYKAKPSPAYKSEPSPAYKAEPSPAYMY